MNDYYLKTQKCTSIIFKISKFTSILFSFFLFFCLSGFKHKELRGQLAIGITANFVNRNTAAEIQVPEISGVARIYNQKFFQDLLNETGINPIKMCAYGCLEN